MLSGAGGGGLRSEVLEKRPRYGGEEVDVGRRVEALLQIGGYALQRLRVRLDEVYDGDVGYRMSHGGNVPVQHGSVSYPTSPFDPGTARREMPGRDAGERWARVHVHGDAHGAQVAHPQDAADDIPAQVVEDEDLPDGIPVGIENGHDGREAVGVVVVVLVRGDGLVEVEDLLEGR